MFRVSLENNLSNEVFKPYLSDKSVKCDKINLNENGELLKSESETAEVFNNFFSNIVKNLKIPEYKNLNTNIENVKDPVFRAILKYKNHLSIIAIKEKSKNEKRYCVIRRSN